jgi:hypothetical protein
MYSARCRCAVQAMRDRKTAGHSEDLGIDGRVMLKCLLGKWVSQNRTGSRLMRALFEPPNSLRHRQCVTYANDCRLHKLYRVS